VRAQRPEVLDPERQRPGLVQLGQVVPVVEVARRGQVGVEAALQLGVAVRGLLVRLHSR
jgi:hypothetical protein